MDKISVERKKERRIIIIIRNGIKTISLPKLRLGDLIITSNPVSVN